MIIFLAGVGGNIRKLIRGELYEHVIFSKAVFSKPNFDWVKKRKAKEKTKKVNKGKEKKR